MKIIIIIIISFLVVGMYAFRNTMLNVHDIAPDNMGLNSYGEDFLINNRTFYSDFFSKYN